MKYVVQVITQKLPAEFIQTVDEADTFLGVYEWYEENLDTALEMQRVLFEHWKLGAVVFCETHRPIRSEISRIIKGEIITNGQ